MVYLQSLAKNGVVAQHDVSKMIIIGLIRRQEYRKLQQLITYSLLHESKALACFLLSMSNLDPFIGQMALDMLHKLNANEVNIFKTSKTETIFITFTFVKMLTEVESPN